MKQWIARTAGAALASAGALALFLLAAPAARAADGPIAVVAAENFYGDIARQIGGPQVAVTSILNSPSQDPHLFETAPGTVRQLADARIVIVNGADYDPWAEKLVQAAPRPGRALISAAQLTAKKPGDNPHLWYDPATMPAVAKAIAAALSAADAAHAADYAARRDAVLAALARIDARVAQIKTKHAGKPVTATEPVFGLMADAIGLTMRNQSFQRALMNETEPSARDIAAFENDLKTGKVKVLIYNKQVSEKLADRLLTIARASKVPVVPVTETQPAGVAFHDWMLGELDALDKALAGPSS
jgi:zinc/manganese transport system substrate-binding protein